MNTLNDKIFGHASAQRDEESPTSQLDRSLHAFAGMFSMNLSPIALNLACLDWGMHFASSPGRQMELIIAGMRQLQELAQELSSARAEDKDSLSEKMRKEWEICLQAMHQYCDEASKIRGVSPHHQQMNRFFMRQVFDMLAPKNWPISNPEIWQAAWQSAGRTLWQGEQNWLQDQQRMGHDAPEELKSFSASSPLPQPNSTQYRPGKEVAVTPGQVVYRNHLMELICYTPQTAKTYPEPVLIVPSWILKYYILDLSPHNSMVNYLVQQGHQVFIISWNNPGAVDRDLGMEDYLQMGIFDGLQAIGEIVGKLPVHAAGYCLGGTLLAIAAAALARPSQVASAAQLPPLASVSLLAAQTDFTEPGEMGVLIDESQVDMIEDLMAQTGYMTGAQMAGSFQFLNSRDLIWNKRTREYWLGVRDAGTDMMAWNADVTRLPARMHGQYLHQLFLENDLAEGRYQVEGEAVSLQDIRQAMFVIGTAKDQVSPWQSVYKILRLVRTDVNFLLASGGHNVGIVSQPGNPKASYQLHRHGLQDKAISAQDWPSKMPVQAGSWWPAWQNWLVAHSSAPQEAVALPAKYCLQAAPGSYVLKT